jgi:glycerol-3-phosphate acyltransferase PlsX
LGFASAIDVGYDMAHNKLLDKIAADLTHFHKSPVGAAFQGESESDAEAETEQQEK